MYEFGYHRPASVAEAAELLSDCEEAQLLAGGMTLLPTMKMRLAQPTDLVDLGAIGELNGIREFNDMLQIGAMTCHADVAASDLVRRRIPALSQLAAEIGDSQVRNRGTLGGSVSNNDPAADYPAAVLGLGATLITNQREITADAFFAGMFETALGSEEILCSVHFPVPRKAGYAKFPNPASGYAVAGVWVSETGSGVRAAVTGAGPCVFRSNEIETALHGEFSASELNGLMLDASDFNDDIHASPEYRAHLVTVMAQRALKAASD